MNLADVESYSQSYTLFLMLFKLTDNLSLFMNHDGKILEYLIYIHYIGLELNKLLNLVD